MVHQVTRLKNACLDFVLNPEAGTFFLESVRFPGANLKNAGYNLSFRSSTIHPTARLESISQEQRDDPKQGLLDIVSAVYRARTVDLEWLVEFALPVDQPLLLQRMEIRNHSEQVFHPDKMTFGNLRAGELHFSDNRPQKTAFFSNGWQSWSPSGTWQQGEKQTRSWLKYLAHPMLYDAGTPITQKISEFSSDMFGAIIDHEAKVGLICGFLSQKEQFGSLVSSLHPEPDLQVWANADKIELRSGATLGSDWLAWQFFDSTDPEPFKAYFEAVAHENEVRKRIETPLGWCSWYYYFQNITPAEIRKNLRAVSELKSRLPLKFFQIDDGFEQDVGNWFEFDPNFPEGLADLSEDIRREGLTPGIWLAPFILQPRSKLIRQHPDWLLRKANGRPVNSGFAWGGLGRALDLTHPDALGYVRDVIQTAVKDWGYPYLKLDFLYAAALPGSHHDPTKTRAQILRQALEMIRTEAGSETILLGCGCPIGSGIGVFDMMRISADVSPEWEPNAYGIKKPFRNEPNMPCARNAIQNIITRAPMDPHWWVNDPDCLLVRADSKLTLPEVQSLASAISLSGGALLLSDDMTKLSEDRLRIAQSLLPVLPPNPQVVDLFEKTLPSILRQTMQSPAGKRQVIALFNWSDEPQDLVLDMKAFGLDGQPWLMREFWTGEWAEVETSFVFHQVPAHGVRLMTLSPRQDIAYLGSDLHVSQGVELQSWQFYGSDLSFELDLGHEAEGMIYLYCPSAPSTVEVDGEDVYWIQESENLISIVVKLAKPVSIKVSY
jgi:alpha-galactosidase